MYKKVLFYEIFNKCLLREVTHVSERLIANCLLINRFN